MILGLVAAGVAAGVALAVVPGQDTPPSPETIAALPSGELARNILPTGQAGIVVGHKVVTDPLRGRFSAIELYEAIEPVGTDICRRRVHYVGAAAFARLRAGIPPEPAPLKLQIALAKDCTALTDSDFAWVQPAALEAKAIAILRTLAVLQQHPDLSDIMFECTVERASDACAQGAEATFRALPLGKAYIIEPLEPRDPIKGWRLAIMPTGPGQLFYDTVFIADAPGRTHIAMRWKMPAPF